MRSEPTFYIGHKAILATPMSRQDYNDYRGWELPADEDGADEGYLVEYIDGGESNHPDHKGYISWSPRAVFERSYRASGSMTFGDAVMALKDGKRVTRTGWNGKGMFLYYVPAASYPAGRNTLGTMQGIFPDDMVPYRDYIAMKTAQNDVVPWVCSQSDALAEDWCILD
jgi:hypothetical protein